MSKSNNYFILREESNAEETFVRRQIRENQFRELPLLLFFARINFRDLAATEKIKYSSSIRGGKKLELTFANWKQWFFTRINFREFSKIGYFAASKSRKFLPHYSSFKVIGNLSRLLRIFTTLSLSFSFTSFCSFLQFLLSLLFSTKMLPHSWLETSVSILFVGFYERKLNNFISCIYDYLELLIVWNVLRLKIKYAWLLPIFFHILWKKMDNSHAYFIWKNWMATILLMLYVKEENWFSWELDRVLIWLWKKWMLSCKSSKFHLATLLAVSLCSVEWSLILILVSTYITKGCKK